MLRALKTLRIQEAIGKRPQEKYLFAGACIAAANKCESNILVQPLYIKSLAKATFLAQSYAVIQTNQAVDLVNYEQWKDMYYDHLIQMHNGII
jgi:heme oxygenase